MQLFAQFFSISNFLDAIKTCPDYHELPTDHSIKCTYYTRRPNVQHATVVLWVLLFTVIRCRAPHGDTMNPAAKHDHGNHRTTARNSQTHQHRRNEPIWNGNTRATTRSSQLATATKLVCTAQNATKHVTKHFGNKSFQAIDCISTDRKTYKKPTIAQNRP